MHERFSGVRGGLVHQYGASVSVQRLGVGARPDQRRPVAEVGGGMPQSGQDQVQFLAVRSASLQGRVRLDQQNRPVGMRTAVDGGTELIGEQPQRGLPVALRRHHRGDVTARRRA